MKEDDKCTKPYQKLLQVRRSWLVKKVAMALGLKGYLRMSNSYWDILYLEHQPCWRLNADDDAKKAVHGHIDSNGCALWVSLIIKLRLPSWIHARFECDSLTFEVRIKLY